jgi:hypothetical protein
VVAENFIYRYNLAGLAAQIFNFKVNEMNAVTIITMGPSVDLFSIFAYKLIRLRKERIWNILLLKMQPDTKHPA